MSPIRTGTVIDLFSHRASDKSLSTRIDCIVAAVVKNGRLNVELRLVGPEPPQDWLSSLTCTVKNALTGEEGTFRIERGTSCAGDHFMIRTVPLPPGATDGRLRPGMTIVLRSAHGVVCDRTFHSRSDNPSA